MTQKITVTCDGQDCEATATLEEAILQGWHRMTEIQYGPNQPQRAIDSCPACYAATQPQVELTSEATAEEGGEA